MTNEVIKRLRDVGLKQNEAEVYLFLLQNGLSTPPQIAKGTAIARTNCYNILRVLEEKGVIEMIKKNKREAFLARDPESLKINLKRKLESVERILPDLRAAYVVRKNKPNFIFFDGWKEVKRIYDMTLNSKEVFAMGSTERLFELDKDFFEKYIKDVSKNNIRFHDLLTSASREKSAPLIKNITDGLHTMSFLPGKYGENLTDILIWEDNIALIALEEPIFGTVITSSSLADTFRTLLVVLHDFLSKN